MTVVESGGQAVVGIVLGGALSLPALTLLSTLSFQGQTIRATELVLPWWGYVSIALIIFLLVLASSAVSMRRVRVSPLAVTRRELPPAARRWHAIVFVVGITVVMLALRVMPVSTDDAVVISIGAFFILVAVMLNLVMPYILLGARLPGTANYIATQRVFADTKQAWRRISGLAFLGMITGILTFTSSYSAGADSDLLGAVFADDIVTGSQLVLVFGFLIVSVSLLLGQAHRVYTTADLTRSVQHIGVQQSFHSWVALLEVLGPAIFGSLLGYAIGLMMGNLVFIEAFKSDKAAQLALTFGVLVIGWAVLALVLLAVEPIRSQLLHKVGRSED